jgi:hypothetical protein
MNTKDVIQWPIRRHVVAVSFVLLTFSATLSGAADCDRACLRSALDQYLNAIIKHDPAAAPLFIGFRQTETRQSSSPATEIRTIYATLFYPPPEMPAPNWPPYDGNWPVTPVK